VTGIVLRDAAQYQIPGASLLAVSALSLPGPTWAWLLCRQPSGSEGRIFAPIIAQLGGAVNPTTRDATAVAFSYFRYHE
jgi:hypothetical protein